MQNVQYVQENILEIVSLSLQIIESGLSIIQYSSLREMLDQIIDEIPNTTQNTFDASDLIFSMFQNISADQFTENFQLQNTNYEFMILDSNKYLKNQIISTNAAIEKAFQKRQITFTYQEILWRFLTNLKLMLINKAENGLESIEQENVGRFPVPISQNYRLNPKKYDPFFFKIIQLLSNDFLENQKLFDPLDQMNFKNQIDNIKIYYWITFTYLIIFQVLHTYQQLVFFESSIQAYKYVVFNGWEPLYALLSSSNCWFLNEESVNDDMIDYKHSNLICQYFSLLLNI